MSNQMPLQAVVVSKASITNGAPPVELALFKADGSPKVVADPAAALANTTAVDLAALKVDFNLLLARLRTAGVLLP